MPASDPGFGLSLAIVLGVVYLVLVRLVDMNEREPLWALLLAICIGTIGGGILPVIIGSEVLTLDVIGGALATVVAMFLAIGATIAALEAIGRLRGWSEVNGVMDGVVYGTAVGLGFAIGDSFFREATFAASAVGDPSSFETLWTTALSGLSAGLFGAIIGTGYGAALMGRTKLQRFGYPLASLAGAFLAQAAYTQFESGDALGGTPGEIRAWIALLLPLAFVVAAAIRSLAGERTAIAEELADEARSGVVTGVDLHLLTNPAARRAEYARRLASGDLDGWVAVRALQNRQVQLALTERNARRLTAPDQRVELEAQAERLRGAIHQARGVLERVSETESAPARGG